MGDLGVFFGGTGQNKAEQHAERITLLESGMGLRVGTISLSRWSASKKIGPRVGRLVVLPYMYSGLA